MGQHLHPKRSVTVGTKELARDARAEPAELDQELLAQLEADRPRHRGDCADGPRPCVYVSCRFHLYLDVNPQTGSVKLNFPDQELWELEHSCALDVAELGGKTLEEIGQLFGVSRERIRQIEEKAGARVRAKMEP